MEGAKAAHKPWLLFLHGDTSLGEGWAAEAKQFIRTNAGSAAAFRFRLADSGVKPWILEAFVLMRCGVFGLPYGDQGLLISRALYDSVGGFSPLPLMEDVDFVRRLGRKRMVLLKTSAITSADRFRREGYVRRSLRNLWCLLLYFRGVPVERLVRIYG